MKVLKRFSTLKKALAITFAALAVFALASCENMTTLPQSTISGIADKTLYAPSFPEQTDENGNLISGLTYSQRYYTVSQGLKRKITLSWNPVEIAKYYQIYAAKNINDTFVKIGESKNASFEDSVGSGATFYYQVRAVNSNGEYSDFSSIVHGTSLATPAINNIEITDTTASVYWYMGNVGIDSYVKDLVYEIHAYNGAEEKVATIKAWDEDNSAIVESYTFENLSGNTDYEFEIHAYHTSDQSAVETSPRVSQKTLAQYTPVSPDFTASQGESVDYVKLFITLPSKIQVSTKKDSESDNYDVDFPVCFEIQRKRAGEDWPATPYVVDTIYFNGSSSAPTFAEYDSYREGDIIEYSDPVQAKATSIARGVKYDYRILSSIDVNYSAVNGYEFNSTISSKASLANGAQGWAAAYPEFSAKIIAKESNGTSVSSLSVGFTAEWNDLDKEQEYKFAVRQNRRKFDDDNGGATDTDGEDSWVWDNLGNIMTSSLDNVNAMTKTYDLTTSPENVRGTYRYTLYVIPTKYSGILDGAQDPLVKILASNIITVSDNALIPNLDLTAEGGWTDHTLLKWTVESDVSYSVSWEKYDSEYLLAPIDSGVITSADLLGGASEYSGSYVHYVSDGYLYKYSLAGNGYQSDIVEAKTLGKPEVEFTANSYTDITVSWPQVMAAEEYTVALGSSGGFGNGFAFTVGKDGTNDVSSSDTSVTSAYDSDSKIFTVTISKPYGYNIASLSGKATPLVVTAVSEFDAASNSIKGQNPASKNVWTIGPAAVNLKGTEANGLQTKSVKLSWTKLEGAVGYAVYRLRPQMTGSVNNQGVMTPKEQSYDVYYVNKEGTSTFNNASVSLSGDTFTFTDNYAKSSDSSDGTAMNQQYLALGIPYTYTVLPVLQSSAPDADGIINTSDWPAYSDLESVQKIGYTTGYGIALEASKAEASDKVVLSWEKPQSAIKNDKLPTVWFRKKGSDSEWIKLKTITNSACDSVELTSGELSDSDIKTKALAQGIDDILIQALEYAVTYDDSMSLSDSKNVALSEYQRQLKNEKITSDEPKCVGYMFTMPKIEPVKQTSSTERLTEEVQWHLYDSAGDRAVGASDITSYALELLNLNCSGEYQPIYTYGADGSQTSFGSKNWYNASFTTNTSGKQVTVTVTPSFASDEAYNTSTFHDGLLKVQRDYKHYYRISATRTNSDGDTITASSVDYAYRKITEDECKKAIGLICADAIFQTGIPDATQLNVLCTATLGNFTLIHRTAHTEWVVWNSDSGKCRIYTSNDYYHVFPRTPGAQSTPFTSSWNVRIVSDNLGGSCPGTTLKELPSTAITCAHETGLPSYTISDAWTVSGTCGGIDVFPYDFGGSHGSADSSLNTSFPTYSSFWWEVR